jgi:PAS domain S-box-containing protein
MERGIGVLHVAAEPGLVDLVATFLERNDDRLAVESATSVDEGLRQLNEDVDCVVSDYEMPDKNGVEFLRAVRERRPEVPFILFTDTGSEAVASEAISAGVTDYVTKQPGTDHYERLTDRIGTAVESVHTEERLAAERRRLRALFERLTQPTVEVRYEDDEPIVRDVNPAFEEVFGYDAAEIVGESIDEYIVPDGRESTAEELNRRVRSGEGLVDVEVTRRTTDGTREFLHQNAVYDDGSGGFGIYTDITDRKERGRELKRRNTRLNALFENFPEPTITYAYEDGDPLILDINEAFAETFGYDEAEAVGEHVDDLIVPPERREEAQRVDDRVRSGEAIDETLRRRTADGIGEFRFRNVRLPDDEEIDGYAIYADVSDRKERERELRRQDELFRKAQDLANVGAWEWYPGREEGHYSERVYDIYGVDSRPEKSPAADLEEFYHPEDRETVRTAFERAVETGEPYDVEVRVIDADGDEKWVRTRGDPELEDGACTRIRGTIRDIADRKKRERELRRHEAILNEVLDAAYVLDEEGRYTFVNDRLAEAYDADPAELVGTESWTYDHVAAELGPGAFEALVDGERTELRLEAELDLSEHGSSVMDVRLTRLPRTGEFEGIVAIGRDVTTQKRRAERLQRQNERLERFAGAVSHDLRTPLEVAGGRIELAREECESDHLSTASDAIDRMNGLIDDILTLAREGDSVRETDPVDLGALCSDCWETVDAPEATLDIEAGATIAADRRRLRRLVENLFRNAIEHGGDDVAIAIGTVEEGFYVADDGPGIPPDERTDVFDRGYSTAAEGTGFGLAIVREIVDAHGWSVRATDSTEGGARFEITDVSTAG